ncbi:MAG: hypothetical protein ACO1N3_01610 [Gammaproteobacteria bacterium]
MLVISAGILLSSTVMAQDLSTCPSDASPAPQSDCTKVILGPDNKCKDFYAPDDNSVKPGLQNFCKDNGLGAETPCVKGEERCTASE